MPTRTFVFSRMQSYDLESVVNAKIEEMEDKKWKVEDVKFSTAMTAGAAGNYSIYSAMLIMKKL